MAAPRLPFRASSRTVAARASPGSRATSSRAASRCWWPSPTCRAAAPASRPWWRASPTVRCRSRSWGALAAQPSLADGFGHLVALDPPPGGIADPQLRTVPRAHLAWGPAEAEFALTAARAELDLRPQLTEVYRALRELPPGAPQEHLEAALRGSGRYPRNARACARLAGILTELSLIELDTGARTCRVLDAVQSDLELSPTYRAARDQLAATERALAAELPRTLDTAATG